MVLLKLPGEAVVCGETVWRGLTIMDGGWWVAGDGAHFSQRRRRRRIIAFCACISSRDDSSGIGEPRGLPRSAGRRETPNRQNFGGRTLGGGIYRFGLGIAKTGYRGAYGVAVTVRWTGRAGEGRRGGPIQHRRECVATTAHRRAAIRKCAASLTFACTLVLYIKIRGRPHRAPCAGRWHGPPAECTCGRSERRARRS